MPAGGKCYDLLANALHNSTKVNMDTSLLEVFVLAVFDYLEGMLKMGNVVEETPFGPLVLTWDGLRVGLGGRGDGRGCCFM